MVELSTKFYLLKHGLGTIEVNTKPLQKLGGMNETLAVTIIVCSAVLLLGLFIWSLVWVHGDAERRGKSGCLVAFIIGVFLAWPFGLLVWLIFRPEKAKSKRKRR